MLDSWVREHVQTSLQGIAKKARQDGKYRFCDVYRLINEEMLLVAWSEINKNAASGVDRVTAAEYEESLIENIRDLVGRLKEKRYRAKLVRRVYIPKADGRQRPLGVPALEEKFAIDIKRRVAICPAGKKNMSSGIMKNGDIFIYFSRDTCSGCTHFNKCVGDTNKAKKRILSIKPHYAYIRERRLAQKTESFQKEMSVRAQVEGTISEATRFHGLRYSRYRGEEGHQTQFYLTGAAINVKRLIKAITIRTKESQKVKA
jgi:hypothetical protein